MNQGYVGSEIAEMIQLPPELDQYWPNRGYYGTLRHNSRAVYQRYMGWYDANPSDLNDLPPNRPPRSTSSTWAAKTRCWRRRGPTSTKASTAGSPQR